MPKWNDDPKIDIKTEKYYAVMRNSSEPFLQHYAVKIENRIF